MTPILTALVLLAWAGPPEPVEPAGPFARRGYYLTFMRMPTNDLVDWKRIVDGIRDDVQYFRDLYNVDRVEVLRGANAMIFGRGGGGGIVNRVTKRSGLGTYREFIASGLNEPMTVSDVWRAA